MKGPSRASYARCLWARTWEAARRPNVAFCHLRLLIRVPMPMTAFLVEDSPTIREELIPALYELGNVEVLGYAEGEREAGRWLNQHGSNCDLVFIDLFLKEGSGLGVLRDCGELGLPVRRIILSNYATQEMRRQALALGADAVFDKSTELPELFDYCAGLGRASGTL